MGFEPASLDAEFAEARLTEMRATGRLAPPGLPEVAFDPERHVIFDYGPPLAMHANGMKLRALSNGAVLLEETYYSIGGGFIATESELLASRSRKSAPLGDQQQSLGYPYPFGSAAEMLRMGSESGRKVAEMKLANEETARSAEAVRQGLAALHATMQNCIDRGLRTEGELPGGMKVKRRAHAIHDRLVAARGTSAAQPHAVNDWLAAYALAVNEENAAGGRVVTSPTNGAAGVVPAVISYYRSHCVGATDPRGRGLPADGRSDRRHRQGERLDLRRGARLPGRSRLGLGDGRRRPVRGAGRDQRPSRECRRDRA